MDIFVSCAVICGTVFILRRRIFKIIGIMIYKAAEKSLESCSGKVAPSTSLDKNDDTNNQMTQQNAQNLGAKKGDKNDEYDEKALIMERKYREIPEDIGGLLREFIKKEHLKDRYGNEDF